MMERHNRKSYQGPAPPKSLKDKEKEKEKEATPRPMPPPKPSSSGRPTRTPPQNNTPASGEIQIANDVPTHPRYNYTSSNNNNSSASPVRSQLEHLSLETQEASRPGYSSHASPASALDVPARPQMGARSASSSNMRSRAALHNTTLPIRAAPAPNGSSGSSNGGGPSWRRQMRDHMTAHGN